MAMLHTAKQMSPFIFYPVPENDSSDRNEYGKMWQILHIRFKDMLHLFKAEVHTNS